MWYNLIIMKLKNNPHKAKFLKTVTSNYSHKIKALKKRLIDAARNYKEAVELERIAQAQKKMK